ncbi:hypothetical protein ABPG75_005322 [Micractinium tetrahymenae]
MDILYAAKPTGCAASGTSAGASITGLIGHNSMVDEPLPPTAKAGQQSAGAALQSIWTEPSLEDQQSAVLPAGLARWQGPQANPQPSEASQQPYRRDQQQRGRQQPEAQQAVQQALPPCSSRAALNAAELEWLCTILPAGEGGSTDGASWLANAHAAVALLHPELSAACSSAHSGLQQPLWQKQKRAAGDAPSKTSQQPACPLLAAGAAQVPRPARHAASSGLLSSNNPGAGSQQQALQAQLATVKQPQACSSIEQQALQVPARLQMPAALAGLPAARGHALSNPSAPLRPMGTQSGGGSPPTCSEGSERAAAQASDASGGASGRDGEPAAAPGQRRFGGKYSDADLEALKMEDPHKWRRILTNRMSLAAHLARQQQQQGQGLQAPQAQQARQKKRGRAERPASAGDTVEGLGCGDPSHGAA